MPREEVEFQLSYYNSMTTWITLDRLLEVFGLTRDDLADEPKVTTAVRRCSFHLPTYIALKDVKKRWGHGQEDVFPVAQFEKLWGDMTSLAEVACRFFVVPRLRGQQLEEPAQSTSGCATALPPTWTRCAIGRRKPPDSLAASASLTLSSPPSSRHRHLLLLVSA